MTWTALGGSQEHRDGCYSLASGLFWLNQCTFMNVIKLTELLFYVFSQYFYNSSSKINMVSHMCESNSPWTNQEKGQVYIYGNYIIRILVLYSNNDVTLKAIGEISVQCWGKSQDIYQPNHLGLLQQWVQRKEPALLLLWRHTLNLCPSLWVWFLLGICSRQISQWMMRSSIIFHLCLMVMFHWLGVRTKYL